MRRPPFVGLDVYGPNRENKMGRQWRPIMDNP